MTAPAATLRSKPLSRCLIRGVRAQLPAAQRRGFAQAVRESIGKIEQILEAIRDLNPRIRKSPKIAGCDSPVSRASGNRGGAGGKAGAGSGGPHQCGGDGLRARPGQSAKGARYKRRSQLVDELRDRVDSFDTQISRRFQEVSPALRQITVDLQNSGQDVLTWLRNWRRETGDASKAITARRSAYFSRRMVAGHRSMITFLVSVWISFVLPRQVVKPLVSLKEAVDHAAAAL